MEWFVEKHRTFGNVHQYRVNGPDPDGCDCHRTPFRDSYVVQGDDFAPGILRHLNCPEHEDEFFLNVWIDGACRYNGQPNARAAWGVYFGPDSPYNKSGRLPATEPQTSTRAEIEALGHATTAVSNLVFAKDDTTRSLMRDHCVGVFFYSDSDYLCKAMTMWMPKWMQNGGHRSSGPVAHFDVLKKLHENLGLLEKMFTLGGIYLVHVKRWDNAEADALATQALDAKESEAKRSVVSWDDEETPASGSGRHAGLKRARMGGITVVNR